MARVEIGPPRGVRADGDPGDLLGVEADVAGQDGVLRPLVGRLPERGDPEHEQLALARGQRGGEQDVAVERVEGRGQRRVAGQRAEGVERLRTVPLVWGRGWRALAGRSAARAARISSGHSLGGMGSIRGTQVFRPPLTPMTCPVM